MKQDIKEVFQNYKNLFKDAWMDLKTKGKRHRQIPNLLTLTRLIAAPLFIIPAAIMGNIPLIIGFTAIFSLTDALDGFIARKWNLTSELGKDLDAICDKVFAGTLLIGASFFNPLLLCNLGLEAAIAAINIKGKLESQSPQSLYVGKIKTCLLYPLLGVGFLTKFLDIKLLFNTLFILTMAMQSITAVSYLVKYNYDQKQGIKKKIKSEEIVSLDDNDSKEDEKTKVLDKEKDGSTNGITRLDEYREMRDIILHEAEIHRSSEPEKEKEKKLK